MTFNQWLDANYDRVSRAWDEHLSYMQDSPAHIKSLAESDKAFTEFAEDIFEEESEK